jgi:hypothetical protein
MTQLSASGLRGCADEGGWSLVTHRGFVIAGVALVTALAFVGAIVAAALTTRRRRRTSRS